MEQRWMLACLSHGHDAVIAWSSAAQLHAMPGQHPTTSIHVLCPDNAKARRKGVTTHRSRLLVPADRTVVHGIPVTTWARTWLELSGRRNLSDRQMLWIYDEGIRRGVMTADDLLHTTARLRSANGRSMKRVAKLLGQRPRDHDPGASQPESNIALWFRAAGFGEPQMNHMVLIDGVRWEIDIAYADVLTGVDYHSDNYHSTPSAREKDARKRAALEAAGWAYFVALPGEGEATIVNRVGPTLLARRSANRLPR